jgi:hypothetical protein
LAANDLVIAIFIFVKTPRVIARDEIVLPIAADEVEAVVD